MAVATVAVTGGNGQIGRALLAHLAERGYETANLARGERREERSDRYYRTDLGDAGDVYGSLHEADPDAVVHLGMIPTPTENPQHEVYESNAANSYRVFEAAEALGVETVVAASSLCAKGAGFEPDPVPVEYLPMDEAHPLYPSNPYGMGKEALEKIADGFARRDGAPSTVATLRYPWVTTEADMRRAFADPDRSLDALRDGDGFVGARNGLFSYVAMDDAVDLTRRAVEATFAGHERFWATAADTTVEAPTSELVPAVYPGADVRADFEGHESLFDASKARDLLGWEPSLSWRDLQ